MLGKLIRYEMPALGRKLLPLYAAWAATAAVVDLLVGPMEAESDTAVVLSAMLYGGLTAAVYVLALVMIIQRFRSSMLGDEGYFAHALPVSVSQHLASKTISALLWILLSFVAFLVTGIIIAIFSGNIKDIFNLDVLKDMFSFLGNIKLSGWLSVVEFIIAGILSAAKSILTIYAAMAIGFQAEKKPVLVSILVYIGVLTVESTITTQLAQYVLADFFRTEEFTVNTFNEIMLFAIIGSAILAAVYFFISKYILEKRLNLA